MIPPDSLSGIVAFVETARRGSFTEAASVLGVTKSAIGKSVTRLEQRLGVTLLHRSTRRLVLTPDGGAYLAQCGPALEELALAGMIMQTKRAEIAGRLSKALDLLIAAGSCRPTCRQASADPL